MDSAVARKNMVDSQVRPSDVTDRRIPRAMIDVPREAFVAPALRSIAYMDGHLAITGSDPTANRVLLAPRTLAKLIQHLALEPDSIVLDVAAGTGYSTAVLARIARRVVAVECDSALADAAKATLATLAVTNAEVVVGGLSEGHLSKGPYDGILISGKITDAPPALLNQLKDGARLVAILDVGGVGQAYEWRRYGMNFDRRALFDAEAPMLPGFERAVAFSL